MTSSSKKALIVSYAIIVISIILLTVSIKSIMRSKESIRQSKWTREELLPLLNKSLELGQLINAEMQAVNQENVFINAELAKPQDQRAVDLDRRQGLNKLRNEKIQILLIEQQQLIEQAGIMRKEAVFSPETENPESKATLEKY